MTSLTRKRRPPKGRRHRNPSKPNKRVPRSIHKAEAGGGPLPELRSYQLQAVEVAERALAAASTPAVVEMPTGTGKTRVMLELAAREIAAGGRVVILAHRDVLIEQLADAGRQVAPVGVLKGTRRELLEKITVASVQTLARGERVEQLHAHGPVTLALVDEAHHATLTNSYGRTLKRLRELHPDLRVCGFTATPYRQAGGFRRAWPRIAYTRSIQDMQQAGWLCPLRWQPVRLGVRLTDIKTVRGDYDAGELAERLQDRTDNLAWKIAPLIEGRPALAFAVNIAHAKELAAAFNAGGTPAGAVWGAQPREERAATLAAWKAGELKLICNVGVLTEGFDHPPTSAIVMARPTQSVGLYLQAIGRATRLAPGKPDALIIDVADNSDPRQILLPALLDAVPLNAEPCPETAPSTQDAPPAASKSGLTLAAPQRRHGPRALITDSGLALVKHPGGTLSCPVGKNSVGRDQTIALTPDPAGSGLWQAQLLTSKWRTIIHVEQLHPGLLPLAEAITHIAPARNGLSAAGTRWRKRPASTKALAFLSRLDRAAAAEARQEHWTAGECAEGIHRALLGDAIENLTAGRPAA
jgi:superfamily II DNA or RNA helicase